MKYRPDIDGLRAFAVLPVVLYHAGLPSFTGGYVGVDVFFVISGYLITGIVARELDNSRFSLIDFYERRARRILPALTVTVLVSYLIGWFVLLPEEFKELGQSGIAAAAFVSNIYFESATDYFATAAEYDPLLHTWSLAVEEQFYLFFPPLLMLLFAMRGRRIALWAAILISVASLVAAVALLPSQPSWVFYLIPFRAWELGLGAILALAAWSAPRHRIVREVAGIVGLLGVTLPVFLYDANTVFPGLAAIPPVVGAALLILVGRQNGGSFATRLLSNKVFVWVGLISYSLYLWHWPILAFMRVLHGSTELPLIWGLSAVVVSILIAWVSWKYVEGPFRARPPKGFDRSAIFRMSAICLATIGMFGVAAHVSNGFASRLSPAVLEIAAVSDDRNPLRETCLNASPNLTDCSIGAPADAQESIDFIFWGDSHADAIAPAVSLSAQTHEKSGLFVAYQGCLPVFNVERQPRFRRCQGFLDDVADFLENEPKKPLLIMHARWSLYVEGTRYAVDGPADLRLKWRGDTTAASGLNDNAAIFEAGLRATMLKLSEDGYSIVLVGPTPESTSHVPLSLARAEMLGFSLVSPFEVELHEARTARADDILQRVADEIDGVAYLPVADLICSKDTCETADEAGIPYFVDDDHLSSEGAKTLLTPRLNQIWTDYD